MNQETAPTMDSGESSGAGMGITALILGIVAFFPGCCLGAFYGNWILAVLAIIFGVAGMSGSKASLAKAGLVLGIIALILYLVLTILGASYEDTIRQWVEQEQAAQSGGEGGSGDALDNDFNNDGNNFSGDGDTGSNDGNN